MTPKKAYEKCYAAGRRDPKTIILQSPKWLQRYCDWFSLEFGELEVTPDYVL